MNKFVIGALAVTSAGTLAYAGGTETREWSTLDRDILSLTSNQGPAAGSFGVNGFVRARGARSGDVDVDTGTPGEQDLSGFSMDNARAEFSASQGDYGAFIQLEAVQFDLGGDDRNLAGAAVLLDAYGTFKVVEGITGQAGRFRAPFLWSSFMVNDNNMVLLDHTFNAQNWQVRDEGVQLSGVFDQFGWWVAVQNGEDHVEGEIRYTGRVAMNIMGPGVGKQEGAFGSSGELNLMVGAAYSVDEGASNVTGGNTSSGEAFGADANLTQGGVSLHFEITDYGEDAMPGTVINLGTGLLNPIAPIALGSETPWSGTAGYMITPQRCEVIFRYEDLDDDNDTTMWTAGVNCYLSGHNAKWTLQFSRSDSDAAAMEIDSAAMGLTVGV